MLETALIGLIIIGVIKICIAPKKKKESGLNELRKEYKAKKFEEVENN